MASLLVSLWMVAFCGVVKVKFYCIFAAEAQSQASVATAKEREAAEQLREQNVRLTTLEAQCAQLRQEKAKHLALLEMERAKIDMLTDQKNK